MVFGRNGKTWFLASIFVIFALCLLLFYEVRGQVPDAPLRVVTYNVGTPRRGEKIPLGDIISAVKSEGVPDLLILQEVHGEKEASHIAEAVGLGHFVYSNYNPKKPGDGLSIVSRYPLSDPRIHYFKACRWAWFSAEMVVKGEPFLVCSVHLQRIRSVTYNTDNKTVDLSWNKAFQLLETELTQQTPRAQAADEFLPWLKSHRSERVIIGGDFGSVTISLTNDWIDRHLAKL